MTWYLCILIAMGFLCTHYSYLLILIISLAGPLTFSFDTKVAFFSKWKFLFPAIVFPALFYIIWDIIFTAEKVWSFNDKYILGLRLAGLPLEEILFFLVVPYCCLFIYECVRSYFPKLKNKPQADALLKIIAVALVIIAVFFRHRDYTLWTFLFTAFYILLLYSFRNYFGSFDATSFLVSYTFILIPFLVVNGLLTSVPVVLYDNAENLGVRIFTIPFEDVFYGMLLNLMVVSLYERMLKRKT